MLPRRWCARSSPPNEVECSTLHLRIAAHRAVSASSRIPQVRMTGDKLTSSNRSGKKQVVRHNSAEVSAPELALLCSSTLSAWVELKGQRRRAAQRLSTSSIQCGTSSPSMMFSNASRGCTRDSGLLGSVVPSSTARTMGRRYVGCHVSVWHHCAEMPLTHKLGFLALPGRLMEISSVVFATVLSLENKAEGWQDAILSRVLGTGSPIGCHPRLILGAS